MANEITLNVSITGSKGGVIMSNAKSMSVNMTEPGKHMTSRTFTVGTLAIEILDGAVTVGGLFAMKNLSTTATIFLGPSGVTTGNAAVAVGPSEIATFRIGAVALFAIAGTSAQTMVTFIDP